MKTTNKIKVKEWVEFALPDNLGWECNDEIAPLFHEFALEYAKAVITTGGQISTQVLVAEYMDKVYCIIRKHQRKLKKGKQ